MISLQQATIVVACLGVVVAEVCSPDKNEYYHTQLKACMKCDSCLRGAGHDTVKKNYMIKWDKIHGALTCSPCVPCPSGYFNDRRDYSCEPCNDCSQQNRYQLSACTSRRDAKCGDYIVSVKPTIDTTQIPTDGHTSKEIPYLLVPVATAAGSLLIIILAFVIFIFIRTRMNTTTEHLTMNNSSDKQDQAQKLPLVVVDNTSSNILSETMLQKRNDKQSRYDYTEPNVSNRLQTGNISEAGRLFNSCKNHTTPKVIASADDNNDEDSSDTSISSSSNSNKTIRSSKVLNNQVKARNRNRLLSCTGNVVQSVDDLIKYSNSSVCSDLCSDTFLKEGTVKSEDTLVSNIDTCVFNRSNCSTESSVHNSHGYSSPLFYCKCYNNSVCVY